MLQRVRRIRLILLPIIALVVFGLITMLLSDRALLEQEKTVEFDVSKRWQKHIIGENIFRDHGHSTAIGDLDGDGRTDALIAFGRRYDLSPEDGVWWYRQPVNPKTEPWPRFQLTNPTMPIRWCMAVGTGDVDNDGDLDVAALSFNDGRVYLAVNPLKESGNVETPWRTLIIHDEPERHGEQVEIIDVDGDGFRDIVFSNYSYIHVLFNPEGQPDGKWEDKKVYGDIPADAHSVVAADFDRDGDLDLANASGVASMYWYEQPDGNARNGRWKRHLVRQKRDHWGAIQKVDVNLDGAVDIIAMNAHGHPGEIFWMENPGDSKKYWSYHRIGEQTYPHGSSLIDIDGDGQQELWVGDSSNGCGGSDYCWNDGGIVFFQQSDDPTKPWIVNRVAAAPETGRQCRAADIDRDGDMDMVSTADHRCLGPKYYNCTISLVWWENTTVQRGSVEPATCSKAAVKQE